MEVLEFIFKLLFGISILIAFFYCLNFIMSLISKFFDTTSTLNGNVVSSPQDYDWHINNMKIAKNFLFKSVDNFLTKIKDKKKIDIGEKIKLLTKLEELKNNNTISLDEYEDIKNKLLNQ
jgi:hypothetical protein